MPTPLNESKHAHAMPHSHMFSQDMISRFRCVLHLPSPCSTYVCRLVDGRIGTRIVSRSKVRTHTYLDHRSATHPDGVLYQIVVVVGPTSSRSYRPQTPTFPQDVVYSILYGNATPFSDTPVNHHHHRRISRLFIICMDI